MLDYMELAIIPRMILQIKENGIILVLVLNRCHILKEADEVSY
jgi:hypothetical protein